VCWISCSNTRPQFSSDTRTLLSTHALDSARLYCLSAILTSFLVFIISRGCFKQNSPDLKEEDFPLGFELIGAEAAAAATAAVAEAEAKAEKATSAAAAVESGAQDGEVSSNLPSDAMSWLYLRC
jgi:hypothetical protein